MALSEPRVIYGVHSFTAVNRSTGEPYGISKVVGSASVNFSGELNSLFGGSNPFAWSVQNGTITGELGLSLKEFPDFIHELFLGKAPTSNAAEASASVTTITNKNGTSVVASTGIASVGVESGEEANVKFEKYVVKAVSPTTVDVFAVSDIDFARGDDLTYQNDLLKVTASALTITQSAAVSIPNTGLELTGDSGTIGMTTNDTATFSSRPINVGSTDVVIGATANTFPEFEAVVIGEKLGDGRMFEVTAHRCKGIGSSFPFAEKDFSTNELTAQMFYDSALDAVMTEREVEIS